MKILVNVPCYPAYMRMETAHSLIKLFAALGAGRIVGSFFPTNIHDIAQARNYAASFALRDGYTHLLMIDNDMAFEASLVRKMIEAQVPVIGCASPMRTRDGTETKMLLRLLPGTNPQTSPCEVEATGAGIMLIDVRALRNLVDTGKLRKQTKHRIPWEGTLYGFFDRLPDGEGDLLGEDISFCARWRSHGGKIFAVIDEPVGHYDGFMRYGKVL